jgi:hypothetical protein
MDIPSSVLAQLGLKVQHALRAFTASDRKSIKKTAENYPETGFYKTEDQITHLGIGEAFITMLNEKGVPTPLVHCLLRAPQSRMDILSESEINNLVSNSGLATKYNQVTDSESAYEILNGKLADAEKEASEKKSEPEATRTERKTTVKKEKSILDDPTVRSMTRTAGNTIVRSLLGVLGLGGRRKLF